MKNLLGEIEVDAKMAMRMMMMIYNQAAIEHIENERHQAARSTWT